jgi:hypothetical protein
MTYGQPAFKERRKIRDIVLEGIELAIRKRRRKTVTTGSEARILP